jgi:excisionase family DNA binding protein
MDLRMPRATAHDSHPEGFLTVAEVARELAISQRTVWRFIESHRLVAHKFGNATRIKRQDLDSFIEDAKQTRTRNNRPP